ncbi:MAG: class I SAM-dependent methyltransferase [Candidatus Omnitrophica bacterium]|nr:class I SAM-dependent methyltransferase [Candidatus Omnitrophota bacterium]MDE2215376.1 class I SAM-dependent methyltransferase [Candidatus Omnitrophota bacterium]
MTMAFTKLVERFSRPGIRVAEVGVHVGHTMIGYLPIIEKMNGHAYAVDSFDSPFFHGDPNGFFQRFTAEVWPWKNHVTLLRGLSWEMADRIERKSLDIVFLDADHRYSSVMKDIAAWFPTVKPGGILCGHDCEGFENVGTFTQEELETDVTETRGHAGVIQAVWDWFGQYVELIPDEVTPPIWVKRL